MVNKIVFLNEIPSTYALGLCSDIAEGYCIR